MRALLLVGALICASCGGGSGGPQELVLVLNRAEIEFNSDGVLLFGCIEPDTLGTLLVGQAAQISGIAGGSDRDAFSVLVPGPSEITITTSVLANSELPPDLGPYDEARNVRSTAYDATAGFDLDAGEAVEISNGLAVVGAPSVQRLAVENPGTLAVGVVSSAVGAYVLLIEIRPR